MGRIEWTSGLSLGIPDIDAQHRFLLDLINRLDGLASEGGDRASLGQIVRELDAYAKQHFALEEERFKRFAYPEARAHKAEHDAFIAKVDEFELAFAIGKAEISEEILNYLRTWLTRHIAFSDKKYRPYLK